MPRRVRDPSVDRRDWTIRASEAADAANVMPPGPERDEALRKAAQLQTAGEMMGLLLRGTPPRDGARTCTDES